MSDVVIDASAWLAVVYNESGADAVERWMPVAAMSSVNLSEAVAKLTDWSFSEADIHEALLRVPRRSSRSTSCRPGTRAAFARTRASKGCRSPTARALPSLARSTCPCSPAIERGPPSTWAWTSASFVRDSPARSRRPSTARRWAFEPAVRGVNLELLTDVRYRHPSLDIGVRYLVRHDCKSVNQSVRHQPAIRLTGKVCFCHRSESRMRVNPPNHLSVCIRYSILSRGYE